MFMRLPAAAYIQHPSPSKSLSPRSLPRPQSQSRTRIPLRLSTSHQYTVTFPLPLTHLQKRRTSLLRGKWREAPRRGVRSTPRRVRSIGTAHVSVVWHTDRAGCNSVKLSRVLCSPRRTRRVLTAWRSSRPCKSALGNIQTSTERVRSLHPSSSLFIPSLMAYSGAHIWT